MIKSVLFTLLVGFPFNFLLAQEDSISVEELFQNKIEGTQALPQSNHQLQARRYGLLLHKAEETPCNVYDRPDAEEPGVKYIQLTDSSLVINAKIIDNCCFSFICDIEVVEDSVINLIAYGYGETHCACSCCFGLTYYLSIGAYTDDHEFRKIKAVMVNNDRETIMPLKK